MEALDCLYTKPLNELQCDESNKQKAPRHFCGMQWKVINKGSITYDEKQRNLCHVQGCGIESSKLKNGIYSFSISDTSWQIILSVKCHGYELRIHGSHADIIMIVYENDMFTCMKVTKDHRVCATYSATTEYAHPSIIIKSSAGSFKITHASDVIISTSEICR